MSLLKIKYECFRLQSMLNSDRILIEIVDDMRFVIHCQIEDFLTATPVVVKDDEMLPPTLVVAENIITKFYEFCDN